MSRIPCSSQNARSSRRKARRRGIEAALALDRFDEDGPDRRRRDRRRRQRPQVGHGAGDSGALVTAEVAVDRRERRQVDRRQQRFIPDPVVDGGARDRHRPERPAVEAAPERDDPRPPGHAASQLQRRVDRLGPGVEEDRRIERRREHRRELVGQTGDRFREAHRRDRTDQLVDLGVDGGGHPRMDVPERRDGDAVREIEVCATLGVEQPVTLAVAPLALEIAAKDRCQVGRGRDGDVHRRSVAGAPGAN